MSVSSGIAMEIHYCMGKKAGVDFYATGQDKCSRCGMKEKKGGCCNDEHQFYKLTSDHKTVTNDHDFNAPVFFHESVYTIPYILFSKNVVSSFSINSPPFSELPLFIRNCIFRI